MNAKLIYGVGSVLHFFRPILRRAYGWQADSFEKSAVLTPAPRRLLMNPKLICQIAFLSVGLSALAQTKPVYENNFEKAEVGKVPDDFLVLDGAFVVKEEGRNKFLELPGAPLDSFGVLFGPTQSAGVAVSARIHGTGKGRRFPTFGVGLNGV